MFRLLFVFLCAFTSLGYCVPPPWIDLPRDDYEKLACFNDKNFKRLNVLVEEYHSLSKSSEKNLIPRIRALEEVIEFINRWLREERIKYKIRFLENMQKIAKNKKWYLEQLHEVYLYDLDNPIKLEQKYHTAFFANKDNKPLFLVNKRFYDSHNGMYWGEYYLEILDPCHRQLTTFHDRWEEERQKNKEIPPFLLWLEEENLPREIHSIKYLSAEEIQRCKATVCNSRLYFADNLVNPIDSSSDKDEFVFIIDLDQNFYLTKSCKEIHHTSLSHGFPVLGAGSMMVIKGIINHIKFDSGHYLPGVEGGIQTLKILMNQQIPFSEDCSVSFFQQLEMHTVSLNEFVQGAI